MAMLRQWLESAWYRPRPPWLLRPLALLFGALVALRRWCYRVGLLRTGSAGVPVIVVGNISVGGSGKTPLVLWLVGELQLLGWRAGIVSRGYGAAHPPREPVLVSADADPGIVGDEALLLARRADCPVCVCTHRLAAARHLASLGCQVIVADDGLQHLALQRDLQIAVVDGARMFGNGALLPAGPLREPVARLRQMDVVICNGGAQSRDADGEITATMRLRPEQFLRLTDGKPAALADWQGRAVHAVAGIGHPARFFATLRALGLEPVEHVFADHHAFKAADLAFDDALPIVMTEKDAVKCAAFATDRMWCLKVTVQFEHADAGRLINLLRTRLMGKQ
jgi:tetraacyldisaccharide 4'-kinase